MEMRYLNLMKRITLLLITIILISCSSKKKEEKTYQLGQIITPKGEMIFTMSDKAPNHKAAFIRLAKANYWDTLTFNRVIENFVIQGGCPDTPEGFNDPEYLIAPEFNDSLKHVYGAVGIGRDMNTDKNSAICQFYIVHNKKGLSRLDGDYMIFGQVVKGLDVLDALGKVETDSLDAPISTINMNVNILELNEKELKEKGITIQ
jgi:peptidyl-prolyl cis-trans isomerase B (cyclophilin B)